MFISRRLVFIMLVLLALGGGVLITIVSSSSNFISNDDVEQLHPTMLEKHGRISKAKISRRSEMQFGNFSNYFQGEDLSSCTSCGLHNSKKGFFFMDTLIMDGDVDPPYRYPWMVRLVKKSDPNQNSYCSGSIINAYYILTAAHCLDQLAGPQDLNIYSLTNTPPYYARGPEVQDIIPHPEFKRPGKMYDIGLVKLKNKIICDKFTNPICLPSSKLNIPEYFRVAGWGATKSGSGDYSKELREAKIKIVNNTNCESTYGQRMSKIYCFDEYDGDWKSICNGDSGGPAFYEQNRKYYQTGIVLEASKGCPERVHFMLTAVPEYVNWIKQVTGSSFERSTYLNRNNPKNEKSIEDEKKKDEVGVKY